MSESLYSLEIQRYLLQTKWPKGLIIDIVEYPNHLALRLYRDNFNSFSGTDQLNISQLVGETINVVRNQGCPCYLEVVLGNGKQ